MKISTIYGIAFSRLQFIKSVYSLNRLHLITMGFHRKCFEIRRMARANIVLCMYSNIRSIQTRSARHIPAYSNKHH